MTPKRENTGNTRWKSSVCVLHVQLLRDPGVRPRCSGQRWTRHHSVRQLQCRGSRRRRTPDVRKGNPTSRQNQTCSSGMNAGTYAFSHTLIDWMRGNLQWTYALTLTHLHSLVHVLQFPRMDRQTLSNPGTSLYMQFPVPPVLAPFPLKHCLFILQRKKKALSLSAYTLTHTHTLTHTGNRGLPATEK